MVLLTKDDHELSILVALLCFIMLLMNGRDKWWK